MWLIIIAALLGLFIYYKFFKPMKYWQERGITNDPGWPLVGNNLDVVLKRKHFLETTIELYNKYPNDRYVGCFQFTTPILLVRDLDLIKQITVKEFDHFSDHLSLSQTENDPLLSKALINLKGDKWRKMRATLSPAFTSSKMRTMYVLMEECAENFANHFKGKEPVAIEMKDIFTRFTNDVIASASFGISVDSLNKPKNEFYTMGSLLTTFDIWQTLKMWLIMIAPKLFDLLGLEMFPPKASRFFRDIVIETVEKRNAEGIYRPDLIHLLMEARKGKLKHEGPEGKGEGFATVEESHVGKANDVQWQLSDDDMVAQALLFFFAGFDTSSTVSCFLAHELAVNPDVQKKLQEEIDAVSQKGKGRISYETLLSMKYLDQVLCETLRLWPPGFQTDRMCVKEFTIDPVKPDEKPLIVEKGITTMIPIMAIHRDPQYYPEPERFDPDRFNDENKSSIVPGSYMPFGLGPRNCIGSRFALLEVKTLFYHLLAKYDIVAVEKTEIPLKISPRKINMSPDSGFWLALKPRKVSFY